MLSDELDAFLAQLEDTSTDSVSVDHYQLQLQKNENKKLKSVLMSMKDSTKEILNLYKNERQITISLQQKLDSSINDYNELQRRFDDVDRTNVNKVFNLNELINELKEKHLEEHENYIELAQNYFDVLSDATCLYNYEVNKAQHKISMKTEKFLYQCLGEKFKKPKIIRSKRAERDDDEKSAVSRTSSRASKRSVRTTKEPVKSKRRKTEIWDMKSISQASSPAGTIPFEDEETSDLSSDIYGAESSFSFNTFSIGNESSFSLLQNRKSPKCKCHLVEKEVELVSVGTNTEEFVQENTSVTSLLDLDNNDLESSEVPEIDLGVFDDVPTSEDEAKTEEPQGGEKEPPGEDIFAAALNDSFDTPAPKFSTVATNTEARHSVIKSTVDQGTSPEPTAMCNKSTATVHSTTTRGTSTVSPTTKNCGVQFPEISFEKIFNETIFELPDCIEPITDISIEEKEFASIGTVTDLCNVNREVDYAVVKPSVEELVASEEDSYTILGQTLFDLFLKKVRRSNKLLSDDEITRKKIWRLLKRQLKDRFSELLFNENLTTSMSDSEIMERSPHWKSVDFEAEVENIEKEICGDELNSSQESSDVEESMEIDEKIEKIRESAEKVKASCENTQERVVAADESGENSGKIEEAERTENSQETVNKIEEKVESLMEIEVPSSESSGTISKTTSESLQTSDSVSNLLESSLDALSTPSKPLPTSTEHQSSPSRSPASEREQEDSQAMEDLSSSMTLSGEFENSSHTHGTPSDSSGSMESAEKDEENHPQFLKTSTIPEEPLPVLEPLPVNLDQLPANLEPLPANLEPLSTILEPLQVNPNLPKSPFKLPNPPEDFNYKEFEDILKSIKNICSSPPHLVEPIVELDDVVWGSLFPEKEDEEAEDSPMSSLDVLEGFDLDHDPIEIPTETASVFTEFDTPKSPPRFTMALEEFSPADIPVESRSRAKTFATTSVLEFDPKIRLNLVQWQQKQTITCKLSEKRLCKTRKAIKTYLDDEWTDENLEKCLETIRAISDKILVDAIAETVQDNKWEREINTEFTPPAPPLPRYQQKLILLVKRLSDENPKLPHLLMEDLEEKLFRLDNTSLEADDLRNISYYYTSLVDLFFDGDTTMTFYFIVKVLYVFGHRAIPMVFVVIKAFPKSLPKKSLLLKKHSPHIDWENMTGLEISKAQIDLEVVDSLDLTVMYLLTCIQVYRKNANDIKDHELFNYLPKFYGFNLSFLAAPRLLNILIKRLEAGELENLSMSFILLAKRAHIDFAIKTLLKENLIPFLEKLIASHEQFTELEKNQVCLLVETISAIIKPLAEEKEKSFKEIFPIIVGILGRVQCQKVQETCIRAIFRLQRFIDNHKEIFTIVKHHQDGGGKFSDGLRYAVQTFIHRKNEKQFKNST